MRNLSLAYGNSRQAKTWVNKTIRFDELKERLKVTIRTPESAEEYAKMNKAQRDQAKDHGGFVGGVLKGGRRKIDTVESRSMLSLDGDRITKEFLEGFEATFPYTSVLYTTHSSTEENPRARIVCPLTRDVTPEEFVAVSRYVAQMLGIDYFDECSYLPNRLMYWPSTPQNGAFVYKETDGGWIDPDEILSAHPEWTDPTRLPTSARESKANSVTQQKVQDPLSKEGVVGLFNRVYHPISKALEIFLSDVYEPTDNENRWHFIQSSSMAGVEIKEDKFVYSHHAKDPAYLKLCNAFDIVRIHKFGDADDKKSFNAMCEFAMQKDDVKLLAANERLAQANVDFSADSDEDWKKKLRYQPKTSLLENSVYNLNLILNNDPNFRNFAFNEMANRIQITGSLPWERPAGNAFWRDADTAQLTSALDKNSRDFLEGAIGHYNEMFHTTYDTSSDKFQNYYKDVSLRMKNKELDLLIVVNMFLTGFDATTLNTLWVDKNLKMHGLIQAFSRTNRILNSIKTFGNIVCFRNLQKRVDAAISLFGDKNAGGIVLLHSFKDYYEGYISDSNHMQGYAEMVENLLAKFPLAQPQIIGEQNQKDFISLFGAILRMRNLLSSFDEFAGKEIISERDLQDYLGRYQDLRDEWKRKRESGERTDITDDVVFEIELIKQIEINIDYILMLVKQYHDTHGEDKEVLITIKKAIDASPELRSKKQLIETFIAGINEIDDVMNEWNGFVAQQRESDLAILIQEEKLKPEETRVFLDNSFREGEIKTVGTDIDRIMPPVSRFGGGNRAMKKQTVIDKLKAFFEKYFGVGGSVKFRK